jgi:glycosyltransferase involved in cell wall biosynthesis
VHGECSSIRTVALRLGCPEGKFFVIPWGIDLDVFSPQSKNAQIRDRYGIKNDAPLIISNRALEPIYRINEIVRGFALVKKKLPEARLMILNDGTEKAKLLNLCKDLAIYDSVHFTGMISHEELPFFLNASDVYVQMPASDSLSSSLLEAMGCGLPVITSGVGGNPEAIRGNGFIVNNHVELAEKVLLMFQRNIVKDLGKKGRDIVEREYDRKTTVDKMEKLYQCFAKNA